MIRQFFVWLHRWTGLLMAGFLILEGLTGSLIAFKDQLDRLFTPEFFATPKPGVERLSLAALAEHAAALVPHGRVSTVMSSLDDQAWVEFDPLEDPATGKPYDLGFRQLFLDPWTGETLGRRGRFDDISQGRIGLMGFIYRLHENLALGGTGMMVLGIVALVWTLDCFVGFYLTLPVAITAFWDRWKPAWLIKRRAGFFRLNFDLHRASGLWLWPLLLIFAWSSVMLDLRSVYEWVMRPVLDYTAPGGFDPASGRKSEIPHINWRAAEMTAGRLMEEQAASHGFTVVRSVGLLYNSYQGRYFYFVQSSLDVSGEYYPATQLVFDGDSGAFVSFIPPNKDDSGDWVDAWLFALHRADVFGLPYRISVCVLGIVITMLSVTGVYVWWKKRKARAFSKAHRGVLAVEDRRRGSLIE